MSVGVMKDYKLKQRFLQFFLFSSFLFFSID